VSETESKYAPSEAAFAREVLRLREARGWTLADMAAALQDEGIDYASTMTVSRTEKLQRPVRMVEAIAYGRIFERSVYELSSPDPNADLLDRAWRDVELLKAAEERLSAARADVVDLLDDVRRWRDIVAGTYTDEVVKGLAPAAEARWEKVITSLEWEGRFRDGIDQAAS
jgi:transcriptional regulator with XRE-family HTH domain